MNLLSFIGILGIALIPIDIIARSL